MKATTLDLWVGDYSFLGRKLSIMMPCLNTSYVLYFINKYAAQMGEAME